MSVSVLCQVSAVFTSRCGFSKGFAGSHKPPENAEKPLKYMVGLAGLEPATNPL